MTRGPGELLALTRQRAFTSNLLPALPGALDVLLGSAFGVDSMPFIMAVAYGASACFLIPYGYQTHLMVYSPGRYRISDFLKIGLPVSLTYSAGVLLITPLVFPF